MATRKTKIFHIQLLPDSAVPVQLDLCDEIGLMVYEEPVSSWLEMAETDLQRMHIERSRLALTYLELFCAPHDAKTMTEEEKASYEAAVERYYAEKEKYGFHYNIWTARYNNR